eukprot:47075-Pelagomonas_calceolata.AAC.2
MGTLSVTQVFLTSAPCRCSPFSKDQCTDGWQGTPFVTKVLIARASLANVLYSSSQDRCIDGLRDTLSTTKRTYEGRLAQLEEALGTKTAKVSHHRRAAALCLPQFQGEHVWS